MKIKINKSAHCGYLYADGHCVIIHQERHPKGGDIQWAEIFERVDVSCSFKGRIVFHYPNRDLRLKLACNAHTIRSSAPSVDNGSDNTRKQGLEVCSFTIEFKDGTELYWVRLPNLLSDGLTYQPDNTETFDPEWNVSKFHWGHVRINKVWRVENAAPVTIAS
jgi:hypothetical protein